MISTETNKKGSTGRLRASIMRRHRLNMVDLFTDHIDEKRRHSIVPKRIDPLSDILVFLSVPPMCSYCHNSKLTLSGRWSAREWFLRFFGRKVFYCSNCGRKETVRLYRWEWETIITAVAVMAVILGYTLHWFLSSKPCWI